MANRRNLKKDVNYLAGQLFMECLLRSKLFQETDLQKTNEILEKIRAMRNDLVSRISHTEPGNVKGFYRKLRTDLLTQMDKIMNEMDQMK